MVNVVSEENQPTELVPDEARITRGGELMQDNDVMKRRVSQYYDKQQQLELVLAAQQLFESSEHDLVSIGSDEEDECGAGTGH